MRIFALAEILKGKEGEKKRDVRERDVRERWKWRQRGLQYINKGFTLGCRDEI